jgi:hypothetical protein
MRLMRVLGLLGAISVAGCLAPVQPEPSQARPVASASALMSLPRSQPPIALGTPEPSAVRDDQCRPLAFDPLAVPGPEFGQDSFIHDESRAITKRFLVGLRSLYAGDRNVDPCDLFTDRGLATMLLADGRLAAAARGTQFIKSSLQFRADLEGSYDLRIKPPRVPIDAIFDLPAGASVTDLVSGGTTTTTQDERIGLHLMFAYDGHRWRVDEAGPVSADYADWATLPGNLPPGPPCAGFHRDAPGAPYDDRQGRAWCDDLGKGHLLRADQEFSIITRYPCGGRATILTIGRPLGAPLDRLVRWQYVRDPDGAFRTSGWLAARYNGNTRLPSDAVATGWSNGNVDLWISPSDLDHGIYMVRGNVVERWARATESWGVVDCN